MEIADIFVVNKADREGADRMVASVEAIPGAAQLSRPASGGRRSLKTEATTGAGVDELVDGDRAVPRPLRRRSRRRGAAPRSEFRLRELLSHRFMEHLERKVLGAGELGSMVDRIAARELDPYTAANAMLARALGRTGDRSRRSIARSPDARSDSHES